MAAPKAARAILDLASRLKGLTADLAGLPAEPIVTNPVQSSGPALENADAIITHVEVNDKHGVGALVRKLFLGEPNLLSIRSADLYEGDHQFADQSLVIHHGNSSRDMVFDRVSEAVGETTVRRILCIPYFPDDAWTGIALKELFGVPLCTYLMDDQNIYHDGIPDGVMRELLTKSDLRLAISPELRVAYEAKYSLQFHYMPPVVPARLVPSRLVVPPPDSAQHEGVMIGNVWGRKWVDLLRKTVRGSGIGLHWFSNGEFRWLECSREDLLKDSIMTHSPPCDDELVPILRRSRFAVLPSGALDGSDDRSFLAHLSLPSRLVYMMATAQLPVIVLGSPRTAAANFVKQYGTGDVCEYNRTAFAAAVAQITEPETNLRMRRNALRAAGAFTDIGAAEWIWQSLARKAPADARYEIMMPPADRLADLQARS
jgi:hypothetical protein